MTNISAVFALSLLLLFLQMNFGEAQLGYNEPCIIDIGPGDELCDFTKGLVCKDNPNDNPSCRCVDEAQTHFNSERNSCLVFLNGNCSWTNPLDPTESQSLPCSDTKAYCQETEEDPGPICKCDRYSLPEKDDGDQVIIPGNRCLPSASYISCGPTLPCHNSTGMTCFSGHCRCKHPARQTPVTVDPLSGSEKCLSLPEVANGCHNATECIPNAFCGTDHKCWCRLDYSLGNVRGKIRCLLTHQMSCSPPEDWESEDSHCNEMAGLACVDGKCVCRHEPDTTFDTELKACAAPEGYLCRSSPEFFLYSDGPIACRSGLECQPLDSPGDSQAGTCVKIQHNEPYNGPSKKIFVIFIAMNSVILLGVLLIAISKLCKMSTKPNGN